MNDPGPSSAYYRQFPSTSTGPIRPESPPSSPLLTASAEDEEGIDSLHTDSLYAILNVDRTASSSEIQASYRHLAHTFHPDRQRDAAGKAAAHHRFQEIQRAHEVLMDTSRRAVYDSLGEEGLRTSWDLGPRNKSPEELRRHFQREAYEKRILQAESLVKSKGDVNIALDARAVFLNRSVFDNPDMVKHDVISRIKRVRPGRITMQHSFEVPLDKKTQMVWSGQMASKGGRGGGNVLGTIKHQFSPKVWAELGSSFLNPRIVTGKAGYILDENTFFTLNAVQQTLAAPPRVSLTMGRKLYPQTTGFITYKSGFFSLGSWGASLPPHLAESDRSALSIGLTTSRQDASGWTVETQAGLDDSHISTDWSTRILGLKLKVGVAASTAQINAFVDAEGKVTQNIRTGMNVQLEYRGGIGMRIRFSRLGQKVSIPIVLAHDLNPYVLAGVTLVPAASYLALYHYFIQPRKKRRLAERVKELREEHADFIAEKKSQAEEAISILERPTSLKVAQERAKHGLIIISAHYGNAASFTARGMRENGSEVGSEGAVAYIDVTIPVQALVGDSKLVIPGGRAKYNLIGFWDPCIGEPKKLRVRYLFKDVLHEVTVDDMAALRIPVKAHALDQ